LKAAAILEQKLLVALIENEINAAFIFVAVARTAYRAAHFSDGNEALSKAEAIYVQASELARDSNEETKQAIADRFRELRQALDGLMQSARAQNKS
jgi:flagellin-specific chaperone FliS